MDRDCNQCVYSTREGGCRKYKCEGTKTVEDIRAEVIEEIKELAQLNLIEAMDLENATKYGNKNAEQQDISYGTLMRYEIADYVDDFMDNVEQLKEKK